MSTIEIIIVYTLFGLSLIGLLSSYYEILAIKQFHISYYEKAFSFYKFECPISNSPGDIITQIKHNFIEKGYETKQQGNDELLFYKTPWAINTGTKLFGQVKIETNNKGLPVMQIFFKVNMASLSILLMIPALALIFLAQDVSIAQKLLRMAGTIGIVSLIVGLTYLAPAVYYKKKVIPNLLKKFACCRK